MAEMTVWRPFADFGELRHRADQLFSRSMSLPTGVKAEDIESTAETRAKGE